MNVSLAPSSRHPSMPPVVRRGDASCQEARAPRPVGPVAPRHDPPFAGRGLAGQRADHDALDALRQPGPRPRPALADELCRRDERGGGDEDLQVGRHAQRIRQFRAMKRAAQGCVVAKFGIAQDAGDADPARADLAEQRQRQPPLLLKPHRCGNPRALALLRCEPRLRHIQARAYHPRALARPERNTHRDLAIGNLAERAAVLPRDADRVCSLLREARAVENQQALAVGNHGAQPTPDLLRHPRGIGDEMLKRLIGAGIVDARQHRAHRLASTVAQQAQHVPPKRAALRDVAETIFELLEPREQMIQPRGCVARQQRDGTYQISEKSTSSWISSSLRSRNVSADLTK